MSDIANMLTETATRLFSELCTKAVLAAAETGNFPQALWVAVEEAGFASMLAMEQDGGIAASAPDAVTLLRVAGRFSAPVPLAETMIARWLLSQAGLSAGTGPLTIALGGMTADGWRLEGSGKNWTLHGKEHAVPWGSSAKSVVVVVGEGTGITLGVVDPTQLKTEARRNIAGEPRDELIANVASVTKVAHLAGLDHDRVFRMAALFRAGLIVGALDSILELSVRYVGERVQFGRPLARLQAIQQQLAVLAGSVAASSAITDAAACVIEREDGRLMIAAARARLADAIDTATGIAHQVHGAMGFAREYALHLNTRRLWAWRDEYGTAVQWRERLGRSFAGIAADDLWPALALVGARTETGKPLTHETPSIARATAV
ncbi:MAG: acyl-CoA dehydrogenase [Betaproteobacteria bacterium]|nr:acyl-CoA dehydrogenase [Betaproteobacteria bacterium]